MVSQGDDNSNCRVHDTVHGTAGSTGGEVQRSGMMRESSRRSALHGTIICNSREAQQGSTAG